MTTNIARCETCKGSGKIEKRFGEHCPVIPEKFNPDGTPQRERFNRCPNCGGAGLKWKGEVG